MMKTIAVVSIIMLIVLAGLIIAYTQPSTTVQDQSTDDSEGQGYTPCRICCQNHTRLRIHNCTRTHKCTCQHLYHHNCNMTVHRHTYRHRQHVCVNSTKS
ncbi:MAG TPA: hypothetical protein ENF53_01315 [Thermoprotei archaeon]|nr:hypothetical protein [Thermoprotei archaeon]